MHYFVKKIATDVYALFVTVLQKNLQHIYVFFFYAIASPSNLPLRVSEWVIDGFGDSYHIAELASLFRFLPRESWEVI